MVSSELQQKIDEWLRWDKNSETSSLIQNLQTTKNYDELSNILLKRLSFGTAGLRGKMSAGYSCMNDLVIIQTGQGLLKYLQKSEPKLLQENGIVIGYDGRHNSKRWAEMTATIFVQAGYKVRLFSYLCPTPFIPFSVKKYKTAIGVMVTASHNPKEDNGYKVYGSNSAQIITPVDKNIQESILENLEPLPTSWDTSILKNNPLLIDPLEEVFADYLNVIQETILPEHKKINEKMNSKLIFTYTPMHGVGFKYIEEVLNAIGVKFIPVPEQRDPDPDFSTVKFPNPEEGKSSLDLSFKTANANNSSVIIANDPDADRLACAEKNSNGEWKVFTGNELGALLGWWSLQCFKLKYPKEPLSNVYMLSSTVSSMILRSMAKKEGFNFVETLTGFKWMGNRSIELLNEGKKVIFAFEEAIGFMCGPAVLDKDGVSGAFQLTTLTSFLYSQEKTLVSQLEEIYSTYGFHISLNSYYICHDAEKINTIFDRIRNYQGPNTYPEEFLNKKYKVVAIRDLTTGFDTNQSDKKAILPVDKKSHMITFTFDNNLVCTLRTSGTEPKIKYYTELAASPEQKDRNVIRQTLHEQVNAILEECFQPTKNALIPQSS